MDGYTDAECGWCVCLCSRVYVVCVLCAIAYAYTQCVGGCGYMCFVYMSIRCDYISIACMCVGCVPLWHLGLVGQVCVHSTSMGRIGSAWYMWVWAHKQDSCLPRTRVWLCVLMPALAIGCDWPGWWLRFLHTISLPSSLLGTSCSK